MSEVRNPDPITGEPRPEPVGTCAVCHLLVLPTDGPIEVKPIRETSDERPLPVATFIHGSFDCMDADRCPESKSGTSSSGEWSTTCLLPTDHPGNHYWDEL